MQWTYNNESVTTTTEMPEGTIGFIYKITLTNGSFYIGKKQISHKVKKKPLKGLKRARRSVKESDWKTYNSSCNELKKALDAGVVKIKSKVILQFCDSKKDLSYFETKNLWQANVLEDVNSWNSNIGGRYFKRTEI